MPQKSGNCVSVSQIRRNFAAMKRTAILLLLLAVLAVPAAAQEVTSRPRLLPEIQTAERCDSATIRLIDTPLESDSLSQAASFRPLVLCTPWSLGGPGMWSLHEGLNANVGFSVSVGLGKHSPSGAGFGEHFAAAYATPFGKDKRWVGALGFYVNRLDWDRFHNTEAGVAGLLGYRVNDRCSVYAYGTYNFLPDLSHGPNPYVMRYGAYPGGWGTAYPFDPYSQLRSSIGAAVEFKLGDDAFWSLVSIAVNCYLESRKENYEPPKTLGGGGNWPR